MVCENHEPIPFQDIYIRTLKSVSSAFIMKGSGTLCNFLLAITMIRYLKHPDREKYRQKNPYFIKIRGYSYLFLSYNVNSVFIRKSLQKAKNIFIDY